MDIKKAIVSISLLSVGLLVSSTSFSQEASICVLAGVPAPEYKYKIIKKLKVGKGSYGSVVDIQPIFSQRARAEGADAVIYYNGSQRFGVFPWRFVRPVITGTAITWDKSNAKPFSCEESGGIYL